MDLTDDNIPSKTIYLSGLNGLRAIAALAVVISHITLGLGEFGLNNKIFGTDIKGNPSGLNLAGYGVTIFFTLSGFLITYLLLKEKETEEINIKNFYIRRILRIWPLYYLYMAIVMATAFFFNIPYEKNSIVFYVFLAANIPFIIGGLIPCLGHYWSLGVEEQFYLFWPWIVKKSKALLRTTIFICISLIVLKTILRLIDIKTNNGDVGLLYNIISITRFHCMMIGAVGAIFYYRNNVLFLKVTNNIPAQLISWIIIFLACINQFHTASFIDHEIISIVSVFLIIGQIEKSKRIINLNTSFFDFIGKISYGIYVIHPILIFYFSKLLGHFNSDSIPNYLLVYGLITTSTVLMAYLSYEFYEKRFLKLKLKYSTIKSSDTKHSP
ncbi:hypothetical protein BH09BAC5_BH09BAC5_07570 [soil metagenome]